MVKIFLHDKLSQEYSINQLSRRWMSFPIFSRVPQFPSRLKTIDVLSMITLTSIMRNLVYCYSAISYLKFLKDLNLRKIELTSR